MICSGELELFNLNDNNTLQFLDFIIGISDSYGYYHKYISLFLCTFGNLANLIHIWVLTRPRMWKYMVNKLLSVIAAGDILKMTFYIIYIIRFDFMVDHNNPPIGFNLSWMVFAIGHVVITIALHTIGLYLWAATAFIRYKASQKLNNILNHHNATWCALSFAITLLVFTFSIPTILIHEIIKTDVINGNSLYQVANPMVKGYIFQDSALCFIVNIYICIMP
uniref:G_PROTEIN_RECEP_F1_2 domain-containing protein n=1 Tax=Acrobeloides nanus TaxID=290746 RepID=A0A914C7D2_9BILA